MDAVGLDFTTAALVVLVASIASVSLVVSKTVGFPVTCVSSLIEIVEFEMYKDDVTCSFLFEGGVRKAPFRGLEDPFFSSKMLVSSVTDTSKSSTPLRGTEDLLSRVVLSLHSSFWKFSTGIS